MQDIKATRKRAEAFKTAAEKMGVEVKNIFRTLGPSDALIVFDASDDETATALMLYLGSFGNLRTQTVRAYQAAETGKILGKLAS